MSRSESSSPECNFDDLPREIDRAWGADRAAFRKRWQAIDRARRQGRPHDRNLAGLVADLQRSICEREFRVSQVPPVTYDDQLPISARRAEIARAIRDNQVVIVCGETGSGKSTQLPKICLELGRGIDGWIGHTQPRRLAARSVASRIAEELGRPLGRDVGFKVRFTDVTSPQTYIKLMTDGVLLAETQHDRSLHRYDTLILDEAHERSLNIDFLLGYLKRLLPRRPDLRVIVTSATIDAERFGEHFATSRGPAPVVQVSGRMYPVEVQYRPLTGEDETSEPDEQQGVLNAVDEVLTRGDGDILIFMPTERHINETAKSLRGRLLMEIQSRQVEILPLYARLSLGEQNKVFHAGRGRRIIIATNVAESSLTVPNIRYVIDSGTARISRYAPRSKLQRLPIEPISQASAEQRKGRCGRVGPGLCIRLYAEDDLATRERFTPPEIQRTNLASVVLKTKALELGPVADFPFLDPPKAEAIRDGVKTLFELTALDADERLTPLGRKLAGMPVDPRIGRMILAAEQEGCLHEVLIIAAALEVQDPRERPLEHQAAADAAHLVFRHEESDFLSCLKLWDFYHELKHKLSRNQLRKACQQNFLSYNRLRDWVDVHQQLLELAERAGLATQARRDDYGAIHRAVVSGCLSSIANRGDGTEYTVAGGGKAYLWPGSGLIGAKPKWVVAGEVLETTRRYLRVVARIDPGWIEGLAEHLVDKTWSEPHWVRASGAAMAFEKVALFGLTIVPRRPCRLGPRDPALARNLFIQQGLVEGEFDTPGAFLAHNRTLVGELQTLQTKSRKYHILRGEEVQYEFYENRIPADVFDGPLFERWRKEAEKDQPQLLCMRQEELLREEAEDIKPEHFPDRLASPRMHLPLTYAYDPGGTEDGITVTVPKEGLAQLDGERLGWLVPGLLEDKVTALIRALPKSVRMRYVPVPETAKKVARMLRFGEGSLAASVAEALGRLSNETLPSDLLSDAAIPDHLRIRIRVVDERGADLLAGRDLREIKQQLGADAASSFAALDHAAWHREGLTTWDLDSFPQSVDVSRGDAKLVGYPALVDAETSVSLRLLDSAEKARQSTLAGLRRLCYLAAHRELKAQVAWLPDLEQIELYATSIPEIKDLRRQLMLLLAERAYLPEPRIPRTKAEFDALLTAGQERMGIAVQGLVELLQPLFEAYHAADLARSRLQHPQFELPRADVTAQLAALTRPGFLTVTPFGWLRHFPRYFQGVARRMERLNAGGLALDRRRMQEFQLQSQRYSERARRQAAAGVFDPALVQFRWLLEEYRISLFAQELGTAVTISAARLDKHWQQVRDA